MCSWRLSFSRVNSSLGCCLSFMISSLFKLSENGAIDMCEAVPASNVSNHQSKLRTKKKGKRRERKRRKMADKRKKKKESESQFTGNIDDELFIVWPPPLLGDRWWRQRIVGDWHPTDGRRSGEGQPGGYRRHVGTACHANITTVRRNFDGLLLGRGNGLTGRAAL